MAVGDTAVTETRTGFVLVAVTALFFGTAPTLARLSFDGGADAIALQLFRFLFGAVGLWGLAVARGIGGRVPRHRLGLLAALAVLVAASSYGYMTSVRYIPVPLATLTFFVFPLLVGLLSHLVGDERLTRRRSLALVIGFAGLSLVLGGGLSGGDPAGIVLAFGAGTCVALSFLVTRRLTSEIPPVRLTAILSTVLAVVYAGIAVAHGGVELPRTRIGWTGLIGNSVCYVVGLSCLYAAIHRLGSVRVAVVVNTEPVISVLAAAIILGELLTPMQGLGAVVVLAGILVMQRESARG